jgi:hypothetical protein
VSEQASEHEQREDGDKQQPVPSCLMQKEALIALILDSTVKYTDVEDSVVKAV